MSGAKENTTMSSAKSQTIKRKQQYKELFEKGSKVSKYQKINVVIERLQVYWLFREIILNDC